MTDVHDGAAPAPRPALPASGPGPAAPAPRSAKLWYLPGFDGLRGVLAMLVVAGHAGIPTNFLWLALPTFFVMSGYFIVKILAGRGDAHRIGMFAANRALRVLPAYLAFVAVMTAVAYAGGPGYLAGDLPWLWAVSADLMVLTQGWGSDLVLHTWSVGAEAKLYLFFGLAAFLLNRNAFRNLLVVLVLAGPLVRVVAVLVAVHAGGLDYAEAISRLQAQSFTYLDAFAAGGLLAYPEISGRIRSLGRAGLVLLGAFVAVSCAQLVAAWVTGSGFPIWRAWAVRFPTDYAWIWGYSMMAAGAALLTLVLIRSVPLPTRVLSHPALVWVGMRSYTLYLFHMPVVVVLRELVDPGPGIGDRILLTVLSIAVAVPLSGLLHPLIERPLATYRPAARSRRTARAAT